MHEHNCDSLSLYNYTVTANSPWHHESNRAAESLLPSKDLKKNLVAKLNVIKDYMITRKGYASVSQKMLGVLHAYKCTLSWAVHKWGRQVHSLFRVSVLGLHILASVALPKIVSY